MNIANCLRNIHSSSEWEIAELIYKHKKKLFLHSFIAVRMGVPAVHY